MIAQAVLQVIIIGYQEFQGVMQVKILIITVDL
jgi:hypothetical protein